MKRVFGMIEAIFNILYLATALILGFFLVVRGLGSNKAQVLAGIMAFVLVAGDAFHLVPRVRLIKTGKEKELTRALGYGKQIASITMTVFYVMLWHIGLWTFEVENSESWSMLVYGLAIIRIILCLLPQNQWAARRPPVVWGIIRNIPFFIEGMLVAALFFKFKGKVEGLEHMGIAILLSFAFYLPVVLWSNKYPKIGMLMLAKTCTYIWMLVMGFAI